MDHKLVFINRRRGQDRREEEDPCKDMPLDLFNDKRRVSKDRRGADKSLSDDYYAFIEARLRRRELAKPSQAKPNIN
jgi:hypothetical protein